VRHESRAPVPAIACTQVQNSNPGGLAPCPNRFKSILRKLQGLCINPSVPSHAANHAALPCSLTLHSRGGPTACHQARATERVRLFAMARAWRPTVGLPLSSNVRQHVQALRFASISIQMQLVVAVGSSRSVVPSFCGSSQGRGQADHTYCYQRSAHVLRRSRVPPSPCPQPKHRENLPLAIHVSPYSSQSSRAKWPLLSASHRKAAGQESSCVLSSSVALCSKGRAVVGVRQAKFWWQSVAFPVQLRNATKKRSAA
jgi:hypothetical protein